MNVMQEIKDTEDKLHYYEGGLGALARLVRKPQCLEDVVARIRFSMPILKQAKLDFPLRQLILSHLIKMNRDKKQGILVPPKTPVAEVSEEDFERF